MNSWSTRELSPSVSQPKLHQVAHHGHETDQATIFQDDSSSFRPHDAPQLSIRWHLLRRQRRRQRQHTAQPIHPHLGVNKVHHEDWKDQESRKLVGESNLTLMMSAKPQPRPTVFMATSPAMSVQASHPQRGIHRKTRCRMRALCIIWDANND